MGWDVGDPSQGSIFYYNFFKELSSVMALGAGTKSEQTQHRTTLRKKKNKVTSKQHEAKEKLART